jgi:hypothetical protein
MAANSALRRVESKILPQIANLLADWGVREFKVRQHGYSLADAEVMGLGV